MRIIGDQAAVPTSFGRRDLLRGVASAGALTCVGIPQEAHSATARVLKMGYIYVRESQLGAGADAFSTCLEAATGGDWRIEHYPGGILGGELELLDGLRKGAIDLAIVTAVVFSSAVPEFGIFDLPFLFRDTIHARTVLDSPIGREYLDKFRAHDLIALAWGETGMRHITNSLRPVRSTEDLRGLRMRVPQSDVMLRCFRQLGVDAAPLGFPALYGALESGRFDGQENPIATIRAAQFDRVQRYLTMSGHVYCSAIIFLSRDVWDGLTPAEKHAFVDAARVGGLASRQAASQAERDGVDALRAGGMEIVPSVDVASFLAALEPTWSQFAHRFGEDKIDSIRAVQSSTLERG